MVARFVAIFFGIILLLPMYNFPPVLPDIAEEIGASEILEFAEKSGLTKIFPELRTTLLEEAYATHKEGHQPGKGELSIDADSTPLQRGLKNAIVIQKFGEDPEKPGNPKPGKKFNDKCEDPLPGQAKGKGKRDCDKVPDIETELMMSEDIIKNGKVVGTKIMTKTKIMMDKPEKGPKKKTGEFKDKWDKFMIGKSNQKATGQNGKNPNGNSPFENPKSKSNSVFPNFSTNNDNDCIDKDGNHFVGDPTDGIDDACWDDKNKIKKDMEELFDEDPVEESLNNDFDCTDATGQKHGRFFSLGDTEHPCFDENGNIKSGFENDLDEDFPDGINNDKDCEDVLGNIQGGPTLDDGDAGSCFTADGTLKDGLTELEGEDGPEQTNNDFDCEDSSGKHFAGDHTDFVEDDCWNENNQIRSDRMELFDEDSEEDFDQKCKTAGGKMEMDSEQCDLTDKIKEMAIEKFEQKMGMGVNDDKDCRVTATGEIMGGINTENGDERSCFDMDGKLKDGVEELIDEDDKRGDSKDVNNDFDCADEFGKIHGGFPPEKTENDNPLSCYDKDENLKQGFMELIDEDGKSKLFKVDENDEEGEFMFREEPRVIEIIEEYEISVPEEAVDDRNANAQAMEPSFMSFDSSDDIFSNIFEKLSNTFGILTNGIPQAAAEQEPVTKKIVFGDTFAPPNIKWGIDYEEKTCFPPLVIFGVTIIPEFCIVWFAVFIGYDFGIAIGFRLPTLVQMMAIPERKRAEDEFELDTILMPQDFTAQDYRDFCIENGLTSSPFIGDCDTFSARNFFDASIVETFPTLIAPENIDGDEIVLRYKAKAGVFVTVLSIPIISWGVDAQGDIASQCSGHLSLQEVKDKFEAIKNKKDALKGKSFPDPAYISALLAFMKAVFNPAKMFVSLDTKEGFQVKAHKSFSDFLKEELVNCSSFTTPYGFEKRSNLATRLDKAVEDFTGEPFQIGDDEIKPRSFPVVDKDFFIRANCLDATLKLEFIPFTKKPLCTHLALNYAGASLGVGLKTEFALGSDTVIADLTTSGDGQTAQTHVKYDADESGTGDSEVEKIHLKVDNFDGNTENARVTLDGFEYRLNQAEISVSAVIDFGGLLEFITDIPAFTMFRYNFFQADTVKIKGFDPIDGVKEVDLGFAVPIPQHSGSQPFNVDIFVENYASMVDVTTNSNDHQTIDVEPGEPETYNVQVKNIGTVQDSYQNFMRLFSFQQTPGVDSTNDFNTIPDSGTFLNNEISNVPKDETKGGISIDIEPKRLFTTKPGIYEFTVKTDSSGALGNPPDTLQIAAIDPQGQFRLGSPGSILVNVLSFPNPLVFVTPDISTVQPNQGTLLDIEIQNMGNDNDDISLQNEFDDFNQDGCDLTTLGTLPECPYRAVPTAIQNDWTNVASIPSQSGLLIPGTFTVLNPQLSVNIPNDWAGMEQTTYTITSTVTSNIDNPKTNDPKVTTDDITEVVVAPTKESMIRYVGLEIQQLIEQIEVANADGTKTAGLLPMLQKPITKSYNDAFKNILAGDFNSANKNLSTLQKQMEAFLRVLDGIDGKNNKLGDQGQEWRELAQATLNDIQTTIDFN